MRGLLEPVATTVAALEQTDLNRAMELHPEVALRDESFGALAYHYGNRRLVFLKSRPLVELVSSLGSHATAKEAVESLIPSAEQAAYLAALSNLERSEVIRER